MKLVQNKETSEFEVLPDDASLEGFTFMGNFEDSALRKLRKAIGVYTDSLPQAPLPDLTGLLDGDIVEAYIQIRDVKEAASGRAEAKDKKFKESLAKLNEEMLRRCGERGSTTIKIDGIGTASRKEVRQVSSGDWEKTYEFLWNTGKALEAKGQSAIDIFTYLYKRINSKAIDEYMKEHAGEVPPGVNVVTGYEMSVRRATEKSKD